MMVKFRAIRLWDNSKKSYGDDWIEIILLRDFAAGERILVADLERSYQDSNVLVTYHRRDNLTGKVSSIEAKQTFFIDGTARPLPADGSFWSPWGG